MCLIRATPMLISQILSVALKSMRTIYVTTKLVFASKAVLLDITVYSKGRLNYDVFNVRQHNITPSLPGRVTVKFPPSLFCTFLFCSLFLRNFFVNFPFRVAFHVLSDTRSFGQTRWCSRDSPSVRPPKSAVYDTVWVPLSCLICTSSLSSPSSHSVNRLWNSHRKAPFKVGMSALTAHKAAE